MKKSIIIAAASIFIASCSKDTIPSPDIVKTEHTTQNVWFKLPPSPDSTKKFSVEIDLYHNHLAECSFILSKDGKWNRYTYQINSDGSYGDYTLKQYNNYNPVAYDTLVNYYWYNIKFQSTIQYDTKGLSFALPPSPNDYLKYFVHIYLYTNNCAVVSYLNIQKDNVWNQYGYFINKEGECSDTEHYVYLGLTSELPTHDTVVEHMNGPYPNNFFSHL